MSEKSWHDELKHEKQKVERLNARIAELEALVERLVEAIESGRHIQLRPRADVDAISDWWHRMYVPIFDWQTLKAKRVLDKHAGDKLAEGG